MDEKIRLSASLEDYIETIYLACSKKDCVRPKDIMVPMEVSGPSVTEALHLLAGKGLINYAPYGSITLTPTGRAVAQEVYRRHQALKRFLVEVLGLDEHLAEEGACKMEHSASANIISRVILYTRFVKEDVENQPSGVAQRFRAYLAREKTGEFPENEAGRWQKDSYES